ncbi:HNH endonuclease [Candidatus Pacearchaeota archaeon]|jgi:5-methylcytosine-specific restriction endonuclease McrA|nr:HNH endonuclease [Candidatus Pacearchaeota archaeon]
MRLLKYSEKQLIEAVLTSTSKRQVLLKLNVKACGGNYTVLTKAIKYFKLNISHFTGKAWNKGKKFTKKSLECYLTNDIQIQSNKLKKRLLAEKKFPYQCSNCKRTTWLKCQIPLELHHKDGNSKNNKIDNLTLLCPNCHSMTTSYCRRKA